MRNRPQGVSVYARMHRCDPSKSVPVRFLLQLSFTHSVPILVPRAHLTVPVRTRTGWPPMARRRRMMEGAGRQSRKILGLVGAKRGTRTTAPLATGQTQSVVLIANTRTGMPTPELKACIASAQPVACAVGSGTAKLAFRAWRHGTAAGCSGNGPRACSGPGGSRRLPRAGLFKATVWMPRAPSRGPVSLARKVVTDPRNWQPAWGSRVLRVQLIVCMGTRSFEVSSNRPSRRRGEIDQHSGPCHTQRQAYGRNISIGSINRSISNLLRLGKLSCIRYRQTESQSEADSIPSVTRRAADRVSICGLRPAEASVVGILCL